MTFKWIELQKNILIEITKDTSQKAWITIFTLISSGLFANRVGIDC